MLRIYKRVCIYFQFTLSTTLYTSTAKPVLGFSWKLTSTLLQFFPSQTIHSLLVRIHAPAPLIVRGRLVDGVVAALAAALGDDGGGARDLLELDAGVVGAAEPVEAPVAALLERGREPVARLPRADPAVPLPPPVRRRPVLVRARVVDADSAAGNLDWKWLVELGWLGWVLNLERRMV